MMQAILSHLKLSRINDLICVQTDFGNLSLTRVVNVVFQKARKAMDYSQKNSLLWKELS